MSSRIQTLRPVVNRAPTTHAAKRRTTTFDKPRQVKPRLLPPDTFDARCRHRVLDPKIQAYFHASPQEGAQVCLLLKDFPVHPSTFDVWMKAIEATLEADRPGLIDACAKLTKILGHGSSVVTAVMSVNPARRELTSTLLVSFFKAIDYNRQAPRWQVYALDKMAEAFAALDNDALLPVLTSTFMAGNHRDIDGQRLATLIAVLHPTQPTSRPPLIAVAPKPRHALLAPAGQTLSVASAVGMRAASPKSPLANLLALARVGLNAASPPPDVDASGARPDTNVSDLSTSVAPTALHATDAPMLPTSSSADAASAASPATHSTDGSAHAAHAHDPLHGAEAVACVDDEFMALARSIDTALYNAQHAGRTFLIEDFLKDFARFKTRTKDQVNAHMAAQEYQKAWDLASLVDRCALDADEMCDWEAYARAAEDYDCAADLSNASLFDVAMQSNTARAIENVKAVLNLELRHDSTATAPSDATLHKLASLVCRFVKHDVTGSAALDYAALRTLVATYEGKFLARGAATVGSLQLFQNLLKAAPEAAAQRNQAVDNFKACTHLSFGQQMLHMRILQTVVDKAAAANELPTSPGDAPAVGHPLPTAAQPECLNDALRAAPSLSPPQAVHSELAGDAVVAELSPPHAASPALSSAGVGVLSPLSPPHATRPMLLSIATGVISSPLPRPSPRAAVVAPGNRVPVVRAIPATRIAAAIAVPAPWLNCDRVL